MLPDLPEFKADIANHYHLYFKNRVNAYLGVIGEDHRIGVATQQIWHWVGPRQAYDIKIIIVNFAL